MQKTHLNCCRHIERLLLHIQFAEILLVCLTTSLWSFPKQKTLFKTAMLNTHDQKNNIKLILQIHPRTIGLKFRRTFVTKHVYHGGFNKRTWLLAATFSDQ